MDKSVYEKQSDSLIIQCLFAQRYKYSQAKTLSLIYFLTCIVSVSVFAILKSFMDNGVVTGLSIGLSLTSYFVAFPLNNVVSKLKIEAAEIQQYIDVTLYCSKQYSHLNDKWECPLNRDQIIEKVSKYPKSGFTYNDKWYEDYSTRNYCEQIVLCQKENIRWDHDLRKKYSYAYYGVMCVIIAIIFVTAVIVNPTFSKIISIVPWCLPFIKYINTYKKQTQADEKKLSDLNCEANCITVLGLMAPGDEWINKEIKLQSGIFEHRKTAVLIPDFFYKLCRSKQQDTEEKIADNYKKVD